MVFLGCTFQHSYANNFPIFSLSGGLKDLVVSYGLIFLLYMPEMSCFPVWQAGCRIQTQDSETEGLTKGGSFITEQHKLTLGT